MAEKNNNSSNVFIWGCGHNANLFMEQLRLYTDTSVIDDYRKWWNEQVVGFIDSNPKHQGQTFNGKLVFSPERAYASGMDACIITVYNNKGIKNELEQHGLCGNRVSYWKDFLDSCKKNLLKRRVLYNHKNSESDTLLQYLVFSTEIEKADNIFKRKELLNELYNGEDLFKRIAAFAWYFGDEIDLASEWIGNGVNEFNTDRRGKGVKTIGLLTDRYYGGGIEKVVSLLIPMYIKAGYEVVLITDDDDDRDFDLPNQVKRVLLHEPFDGNLEKRLRALETCIKDNGIDIVVFHTGYSRLETFYEMFLVRMMGVSAVMELHSSLRTLLNDRHDISLKFRHLFLMANEMVAVSSLDKSLLEEYGCSCTYIQNPIETFGIGAYTELETKGYYQILWTGRIIQRAKRVFDTVAIMKIVAEKMPNVRMRIIGGMDEPKIYEELCSLIEETGLRDKIDISNYKKDIQEEYAEADIVLITSESESFSNVLAEAKVMSRPVVMYSLPWLSLVEEPRGVYSVGQGDVSAAAGAIIWMLSKKERLAKYSKESWDSIQPFISHDIIGDWKAVFDKV